MAEPTATPASTSTSTSTEGWTPTTAPAATAPTLEDALALGLTGTEYELVCEKQGRPPNRVELAMYSLLWSEHCAYKHSRKLLRTLPTEGEHVVMGPGENAGAVDVGGGLRVRVQGRVPQPPERGRAVSGGRDRRRRDSARHLRGRRTADRGARLAALRRVDRAPARATCSTAPSRGSGTTATRSACRRSAARCTSRRPTSTTAWST